MSEQVISQVVPINKAGIARSFQFRLPENTIRVLGIETSLRMGSFLPPPIEQLPVIPEQGLLLPFNSEQLIAEMTLMANGCAGMFYRTEIRQVNNMIMGDFTTRPQMIPKAYTHQGLMPEDAVFAPGKSTVINGVIRDRVELERVRYLVSVFLWIQTSDEPYQRKGGCGT